MCGRFTLKTPTETVASLFPEIAFPKLTPRYNIAPTQMVQCVRYSRQGTGEVVPLRWGLIPFWSKDTKIGNSLINARAETVATKPAFRAAFRKRRCLVLADGFFEWQKNGKQKLPHYITLRDESPFCMAGLWESWSDKTAGRDIESFTIITTTANELVSPLHDRMPVIVPRQNFGGWLDREFADLDWLQRCLAPIDAEQLKLRPVNKIVNKPAIDSAQCILPA
jgi:putative SOS response-associated peptidase YedK